MTNKIIDFTYNSEKIIHLKQLTMKLIVLLAVLILLLSGCVLSPNVEITFKKPIKDKKLSFTISNVQIKNKKIVLTGKNLDTVKNFSYKDVNGSDQVLQIESQTSLELIAGKTENIAFVTGRIIELLLSSASASQTLPVQFDLCDSILGGKGIDCNLIPKDKDVLSYDAALDKWSSRSINGINYLGVLNNPNALPSAGNAGDYFIIGTAGDYLSITYKIGDWIVLSSDAVTWEKLSNSNAVTSLFARTGAVTATKGDYILNKMGDVDLSTIAPVNGNVLQFNGSNWVPGTVVGAGAGVSVTSVDWTTFNNKAGTGSPTFTGVPLAPTAAANTSTTQIATTAFVLGQVGSSNITTLGTITSGLWNGSAIDIAHGGTGAVNLGAAQAVLGITAAGALTGNVPVLGTSGIIANNLCSGSSGGGSISCATANTSAGLLGLISDKTGSGVLVFATSPTLSNPVISNIAPAVSFTLTQNGVVPFTSESNSAVANTLYLKVGNVGVGINSPSTTLDVNGGVTVRALASAPLATAAQGKIYFDLTANKFKVSENGGAYIDLVGVGGGAGGIAGSGTLNSIPLFTNTGSIGNSALSEGPSAVTATAKNLTVTNGQMYTSQKSVASGTNVDFNTGNVQILEAPGAGGITLSNMQDGGSYSIIVTDPTSRIYTFNGCTLAKFVPPNAATSGQTMYSIMKVSLGGTATCFISWITGF